MASVLSVLVVVVVVGTIGFFADLSSGCCSGGTPPLSGITDCSIRVFYKDNVEMWNHEFD